MSNKYYHYCNKPLHIDYSFNKYGIKRIINKPEGIWLSIGEEWKKWCLMEDYCLEQLYTQNEIKIIDMSKIIEINTKEEVDNFIYEYEDITIRKKIYTFIDWSIVMRKYDGIIINNFYELKFSNVLYDENYMWLYSWDVPSACIWNPKVLKVVESKDIHEEIEKERRNYDCSGN